MPRRSSVSADSEGHHVIRTVSVTALRPGSSTPRLNRIVPHVVGMTSDDMVANGDSNVGRPDRARTRHEVNSPRIRRSSATTDSSPQPPVPPPVACRPRPTTPSRPSSVWIAAGRRPRRAGLRPRCAFKLPEDERHGWHPAQRREPSRCRLRPSRGFRTRCQAT